MARGKEKLSTFTLSGLPRLKSFVLKKKKKKRSSLAGKIFFFPARIPQVKKMARLSWKS